MSTRRRTSDVEDSAPATSRTDMKVCVAGRWRAPMPSTLTARWQAQSSDKLSHCGQSAAGTRPFTLLLTSSSRRFTPLNPFNFTLQSLSVIVKSVSVLYNRTFLLSNIYYFKIRLFWLLLSTIYHTFIDSSAPRSALSRNLVAESDGLGYYLEVFGFVVFLSLFTSFQAL